MTTTRSALLQGIVLQGRATEAQRFADAYVGAVEAPEEALAAARATVGADSGWEAVAVELGRRGLALERSTPATVDAATFGDRMERWGRESVRAIRRDPRLLRELRIGAWTSAAPGARLALRAATMVLAAAPPARTALVERLPSDVAAAAIFWHGVRREATAAEWRRLTSGYAVLLYHRLAGAGAPGQERVDVAPARFRRDMAILRALRFEPLDADALRNFHAPDGGALPGRLCCLVTLDDAFADVVAPLAEAADRRPQLFVPSAAVGGRAAWLDEEPLASWGELRALQRRGVRLGSHTRTHPSLPDVTDEELDGELSESRDEIRRATGETPSLLAYPFGRSDERVRAAAAAAGYALGFGTTPGLNGAGSDPYDLRRVSVKQWDTRAALVWKAATGTSLPGWWERWLLLRSGILRRLRGGAPS